MRYTRIPNDIIRSNLLNASDFRIWCFIASTDKGHPFTTQMACEALGINDKTWRKSVRKLEALGMIKTTREEGREVGYNPVLSPTEWSKEPLPKNGNPPLPKNGNPPLPKNGNPPCQKVATPLTKKWQPPLPKNGNPLEYILNNNILNNNNIENNILENNILEKEKEEEKEKETDEQQLVKNIVSGQWAEAMMKNYELSADTLLWLVNDAIIYLYASNKPITEQAVKTAAMSSARINRDQLRERKKKADLKATPIQVRKDGLRAAIAPHVDKYGRDLCNRFFRHWTECDEDGIMRFERCTAWNTESRLANFT